MFQLIRGCDMFQGSGDLVLHVSVDQGICCDMFQSIRGCDVFLSIRGRGVMCFSRSGDVGVTCFSQSGDVV